MHTIDFLPARYAQRKASRGVNVWRLAVVGIFGSAILAAATGQYCLRRSAEDQLDSMRPHRAQAELARRQFAQQRARLDDARSQALLCAWLDHPWPRTRLISEVTQRQPDEVVLSEIAVGREATGGRSAGRSRSRDRGAEEGETQGGGISPARGDLRRLRREAGETPIVIRLSGRSTDVAMLHRYVARLGESEFFERAELGSHEGVAGGEGVEFHILLRVRPGHGVPAGLKLSTAARRGDA